VPRLASLLAVAALAACGGGDSSSTPDPATLVLRSGDVPSGFARDPAGTGEVTNANVAQGRPSGYEQKLEDWGRVGGYSIRFRRKGTAAGPLAKTLFVDSRSSVYDNDDGAHESFQSGLRDYALTGFREVPFSLGVGDETHVFQGSGPLNGQTVTFVVGAWRTGPVLSTVAVAAPPGGVRPAALKGLAQAQERHVQQGLDE
jgi:hypothetical protein